MTVTQNNAYRSTESKYKGGASEMYISYDLEQQTRGGNTALMPKIKRVYIAGEVKEWKQGDFCKRSGREVHGVRIEYQQSRSRYRRRSFHAKRDQTDYHVAGTGVRAANGASHRSSNCPRVHATWRFTAMGKICRNGIGMLCREFASELTCWG